MVPTDASALGALGYDAFFRSKNLLPDTDPARVTFASRGAYVAVSARGARSIACAGRLLHDARGPEDLPHVGDWVALRGEAIVHVYARATALVRKAAGKRPTPQVLAANVDRALIVSAANAELNARRVERMVAMAMDGGVAPLLVLNKLDACADPSPFLDALRAVAGTIPIVATSATRGDGLAELAGFAGPGVTVALIGSSGVGKSALTNALLGRATQREGATRASDERGRHTTAHRELFALPTGGLLVDTPGLRELALFTDDVEGFDDLEAFAARCRFRDCTHDTEPGCEVVRAASSGALAPERLAAWHKLRSECAAFRSRHDVLSARAEKRRIKAVMRAVRANRRDRTKE
jgi:ribosome biogenesis GTPase